jgi:hypothetical protein
MDTRTGKTESDPPFNLSARFIDSVLQDQLAAPHFCTIRPADIASGYALSKGRLAAMKSEGRNIHQSGRSKAEKLSQTC